MVKLATQKQKRSAFLDLDSAELHRPVLLIGLALFLMVLSDLVAAWWVGQWGNPASEMGVITQTFGRMPMLMLSLAILAGFGLLAESAKAVRTVSVLFGLLALAVLVLAPLYGLSALEVWRTVRPDLASAFKVTGVQNAFLALVLFFSNAGLFWYTWRLARVRKS